LNDVAPFRIGSPDSNVSCALILAFETIVLVVYEHSGFQPATESWSTGFQESGNERPVYIHSNPYMFQISIWQGARPFQMKNRFINQNLSFEKS
jgi:hypothetical protein